MGIDVEKEREDFEAWMAESRKMQDRWDFDRPEWKGGNYRHVFVQQAWEGWLARALTAIEQPIPISTMEDAREFLLRLLGRESNEYAVYTRTKLAGDFAFALAKAITSRPAATPEAVRLREALEEVCLVLESGAPAIVDTVWVSSGLPETLLDHCRAALDFYEAALSEPGEGKA
jgi:hypothetical protein